MRAFLIILLVVTAITVFAVVKQSNFSSPRASEPYLEVNAIVPPRAKTHYVPNGRFEQWVKVEDLWRARQWDKPYVIEAEQNRGQGFKSPYSLEINFPVCPEFGGVTECSGPRQYANKSIDFKLEDVRVSFGKPYYFGFEHRLNRVNTMSGSVSLAECEGNSCKAVCEIGIPIYDENQWKTRVKKCPALTQGEGKYYQVLINAMTNNISDDTKVTLRLDNVRIMQ